MDNSPTGGRNVASDQTTPAAGTPHLPDGPGRGRAEHSLTRTWIFGYDLAVLAVLVAIGACDMELPRAFTFGGDPYKLAIESMWFGSLGGVIISLKGIYDHSGGADAWDRSYNLWHLGRPVSGAIAGLMTVVLLKAINANGELTRPVVYAAAFIFGTQERRFFNFLYEVARLIVQVPEESKSGLQVANVNPAEGSCGAVIVITGKGIEPNATVKLGGNPVEKLVVSSDGTTAAGIIPNRPLGADPVDVIVANSADKNVVLPGRFRFTG